MVGQFEKYLSRRWSLNMLDAFALCVCRQPSVLAIPTQKIGCGCTLLLRMLGQTHACMLRAILLRLYGNARLKVAALRDEQEQDTADYALLLVLVALAAIAAMSLFASRINSVFTQISTILDAYIR